MTKHTFIKEDVYAAARILGCGYEELVSSLSKLGGGITIIPLYQDAMPPEGVRCGYSKSGKRELGPRKPKRLGYLLGPSKNDPSMVKVIWDGSGVPQYFHRNYIDAVT